MITHLFYASCCAGDLVHDFDVLLADYKITFPELFEAFNVRNDPRGLNALELAAMMERTVLPGKLQATHYACNAFEKEYCVHKLHCYASKNIDRPGSSTGMSVTASSMCTI